MTVEHSRAKLENFITPKEASAYLSVNHRTFLNWLKNKKKKIPHRRLGVTCIRIPRDKFIKWANAGTED